MKPSTLVRLVVVMLLIVGTLKAGAAEAGEVRREVVPLFGASGDFIVGPGKVEYTIEPGETKTAELIITNRLGEEAIFSLTAEDAAGSSDPTQSIMLLGTDRGPYSLQDYLTFPVEQITLAHGERARIPVTITVPVDAEPGGRYGSVLVSVISDETIIDADSESAAPRSVVVSRVGALYFITVPGEVEVGGELKEFATLLNTNIYWGGPIDFEILFENTGSVHLNPHGDIAVTNMFNETTDILELQPWYTMPDSLRNFEATLDRRWLFGAYTASLNLERGYDGVVDTAEANFIVVPKEVLWIISGLLLIISLVIAVRRLRLQQRLTPSVA